MADLERATKGLRNGRAEAPPEKRAAFYRTVGLVQRDLGTTVLRGAAADGPRAMALLKRSVESLTLAINHDPTDALAVLERGSAGERQSRGYAR